MPLSGSGCDGHGMGVVVLEIVEMVMVTVTVSGVVGRVGHYDDSLGVELLGWWCWWCWGGGGGGGRWWWWWSVVLVVGGGVGQGAVSPPSACPVAPSPV